jgi:hypothetical protein
LVYDGSCSIGKLTTKRGPAIQKRHIKHKKWRGIPSVYGVWSPFMLLYDSSSWSDTHMWCSNFHFCNQNYNFCWIRLEFCCQNRSDRLKVTNFSAWRSASVLIGLRWWPKRRQNLWELVVSSGNVQIVGEFAANMGTSPTSKLDWFTVHLWSWWKTHQITL